MFGIKLPSPDVGRRVGDEGRVMVADFEIARDRRSPELVEMYEKHPPPLPNQRFLEINPRFS